MTSDKLDLFWAYSCDEICRELNSIVSSLFDFLTFGVLLFALRVDAVEFRTGWFVESLLTEIVIISIMRTKKAFYRSRASRPLMAAMIVVALIAVLLPYSPFRDLLGFTPLSAFTMTVLVSITLLYAAASEITKRFFFLKRAKDSSEDVRNLPKSDWKLRHGPCPT